MTLMSEPKVSCPGGPDRPVTDAVSSPRGISLRYLIDNFLRNTKAAGIDWSLPASSREWRIRIDNFCFINATSDAECVADGHFFLPGLFQGPAEFSGRFIRRPAVVLYVLLGNQKYDFLTYKGNVDRFTTVIAAPIDALNVVRQDLAVTTILEHICLPYTRDLVHNYIGNSYFEGVTSKAECTLLEFCRNNDATENDTGPAQLFVSHTWSDKFCDTVDCLLPSFDDCYRAMVEPVFSMSLTGVVIMVLYIAFVLFVPLVGWLLLPILGRREYVIDHIARPRWWTPHSVVNLGKVGLWMDIFCKNQHRISSTLYQGDTSVELRECVQACGQTVLACTPWQDPNCLRRIWCQYEVHHTNFSGMPLRVVYPSGQKDDMDKSMYSWVELFRWLLVKSPNDASAVLLGKALSNLRIENARATVALDKITILSLIATDFGGNGHLPLQEDQNVEAFQRADNLIRLAAVDGVTRILGGKTANARIGERRPRQIPWSYRVAMYSFLTQTWTVLIVLVSQKLVAPYILLFLAAFCLVSIASTFLNMSAKGHQMTLLLEHANLSLDYRMAVFRRERGVYLLGCVASLCGMIVCIYFGVVLVL